MTTFILFVIAVVVAVYGSELAEVLQKLFTFLDKLNPKLKRVFVALVVYGLSLVASKLFHMTGLLDTQGIATQQFSSLFSVGLAYVFHTQDKLREDK